MGILLLPSSAWHQALTLLTGLLTFSSSEILFKNFWKLSHFYLIKTFLHNDSLRVGSLEPLVRSQGQAPVFGSPLLAGHPQPS